MLGTISPKFLLFSILFSSGFNSSAQVTDAYFLDSIRGLSNKQIIAFVDTVDLNLPITMEGWESNGEDKSTIFTTIAHSYGFYADKRNEKVVRHMITTAKEPIENPFFFLIDCPSERIDDVFEYFALLKEHNHGVDEKDFWNIKKSHKLYGYDVNYQDRKGKTYLMHALEFGYEGTVKRLIREGIDVSLRDNRGRNAIDYTDDEATKKMLKKAKRKNKKKKKRKMKRSAQELNSSRTV